MENQSNFTLLSQNRSSKFFLASFSKSVFIPSYYYQIKKLKNSLIRKKYCSPLSYSSTNTFLHYFKIIILTSSFKKKNYLSTSLTFSQITPRIFPLSKSTKTLVPRVFRARNERPLPPIDSCRSGSRGTSRESWKLLHPCTNMHARAKSLSARVVRFFHQPTKPPSLLPSCPLENDKFFDAPSVTMTSGSNHIWEWISNYSRTARCRVVEIELSCGVNVGSFTLDGARDGPEWEIIDCNWILRVRRAQKLVGFSKISCSILRNIMKKGCTLC